MKLIGRFDECRELKRLTDSDSPEFAAVYGRRRVGKTFLIKEFFNYSFTFYTTGLANGGLKDQLLNFHDSLIQYGLPKDSKCPETWFEAFKSLKKVVESSRKSKKVIFIDELPWLDTPKSKFVTALDWFWNSWASQQDKVLLIVCGSAASWMVKNIIKNKGGLHNRITSKIKLMPFSLSETLLFLESKKIHWDKKTTAEAYMVFGGIPYYLSLLDRNRSLYQNIDDFFFKDGAKLEDEFTDLYSSLFKKSADYIKIIHLLSKKKTGYIRQELLSRLKWKDGGSLTRRLEELEHCGFIRKYKSLGDAHNIYQLIDFFSLFYFQFVQPQAGTDNFSWASAVGTHQYSTWTGLAFERLCFSQTEKIKTALGFGNVITKTYPYYDENKQIDMVIERNDKAVSLCEIKWSEGPYSLTSSDKAKIAERKAFLQKRFTGKSIFTVFITSSGVVENDYTRNNVNDIITVDSLFT